MRYPHKAKITITKIQELKKSLSKLFFEGRRKNGEIAKLRLKEENLHATNPDLSEIRYDKREIMRMYFLLVIFCLSIPIDFLLMYQALAALCDQGSLPGIIKYLGPVILIVVEAGVSYFQIQAQRDGDQGPWPFQNTQYLVLFLLVACTVFTVVLSIVSFNQATESVSLGIFALGTILWQFLLLLASVLLHLWIIRNAESIGEAFILLHYRKDWMKLVRQREELESRSIRANVQPFTEYACTFVQKINSFKREFPELGIDFAEDMPADLVAAINVVLGKTSIAINNPPNKK